MGKKILFAIFAVCITGIHSHAQYLRMNPDEGFTYLYDSTALTKDEVTAIYLDQDLGETESKSWNKTERIIPETVTYQGKKYKVTQIDPSCLLITYDKWSYAYDYDIQVLKLSKYIRDIPEGLFNLYTYGRNSSYSWRPKTLQSIEIDEANPYYISINGVLYNKDTTRIVCYPISNSTRYGEMSFPESVKTIGRNVFRNVDFEIHWPVNVDTIAYRAFCAYRKAIEIPKTVTYIEAEAFREYDYDSIRIPENVKHLGNGAFCDSYLTSVDMSEMSITNLADSLFSGSFELNNIKFPLNVTTIGNYAFYYCYRGLTQISIPATVTKIGKGAFCDCSSLNDVIFPLDAKLTEVSDSAFYRCNKLKNIQLPNGTKRIGDEAFYGCKSISEFIFPTSLTTIGDYAFRYANLSIVDLSKTSITEIGSGAFFECNIKNITFPPTLTTINDWAFYGNSLGRIGSMDTIDLGISPIKYIGDYAFYPSSYSVSEPKIKCAILPSTIEFLGECSLVGIEQVIFLGSTPPTLNGKMNEDGYMYTPFDGARFVLYDKGKTKIYVPNGTREAYINEPTWKELVDPDYVFEMSELTPVEQIKTDQPATTGKDEIYDMLGRKVTNPQKGIYIINGKKVLLK